MLGEGCRGKFCIRVILHHLPLTLPPLERGAVIMSSGSWNKGQSYLCKSWIICLFLFCDKVSIKTWEERILSIHICGLTNAKINGYWYESSVMKRIHKIHLIKYTNHIFNMQSKTWQLICFNVSRLVVLRLKSHSFLVTGRSSSCILGQEISTSYLFLLMPSHRCVRWYNLRLKCRHHQRPSLNWRWWANRVLLGSVCSMLF